MTKPTTTLITQIILRHYPAAQGIYLFGSYGTGDEWPNSDVDLAFLLPPAQARAAKSLAWSQSGMSDAGRTGCFAKREPLAKAQRRKEKQNLESWRLGER